MGGLHHYRWDRDKMETTLLARGDRELPRWAREEGEHPWSAKNG